MTSGTDVKTPAVRRGRRIWVIALITTSLLAVLAGVITCIVLLTGNYRKPTSVIFMISDGFGPYLLTLALALITNTFQMVVVRRVFLRLAT